MKVSLQDKSFEKKKEEERRKRKKKEVGEEMKGEIL